MTGNLDSIVTTLSNMTVLELNSLRKRLEEEWDVTAAAPMVAAVAAAGPVADAVQQTEFNVVITAVADPSKKLMVIKAIREERSDINLIDAKNFLEALPKAVKEGVNKKEAEECKAKLEAAGAVIELK